MLIEKNNQDPDTITLPCYAEKCPRCGNEHLGLMLTLHLEFCTVCDVWIRFGITSSN